MLIEENIDICLLQETEIIKDYPIELLSAKDFKIEPEKSLSKARSAIIIRDGINYERKKDIEKTDCGIVIIDVFSNTNYRIINVYRQFNPPGGITQLQFFTSQLEIIRTGIQTAGNKTCIVAGDFNLDENKRFAVDYRFKQLFELEAEFFEPLKLIQVVYFTTWQRIVNNSLKESVLDHVYVRDPNHISNLKIVTPLIGDHKLLTFNIAAKPETPKVKFKRNWTSYSKESLVTELRNSNINVETDNVQSTWNLLENYVINVVDNLAPLVPFVNNSIVKPHKHTETIKRKLNLRRRLLKKSKVVKDNVTRDRINQLNSEIRLHFHGQKAMSIRRKILPGNSKSLWDAVKIAKNINIPTIPENMYYENILTPKDQLPDTFANYFEKKVQTIVREQKIEDSVYNGKRKINCLNENFMNAVNLKNAVKSLKIKNCEGHDRIPQRVLIDGFEILEPHLTFLFDQIYKQKQLPQQWLISKIMPIFKKGDPNQIENYRPISNLCSTSKLFEKMILLRLQSIEKIANVDLTGKSQHGFKTKRSTNTAGLTLQSLIARALDGDSYALMASLDLSSAFDVVNVELLLKRLRIIGIPNDLVDLISEWLKVRYFYVSIDGSNSYIHLCDVGTVQGSILGPILYALFVCPLLDLAKMTLFADDNFILKWNKQLSALITDMEKTIEMITKWLRQSGMKVNGSKTEICLFHRKDKPPSDVII